MPVAYHANERAWEASYEKDINNNTTWDRGSSKHFLETTFISTLATPSLEAAVVAPLTRTPCHTDASEERRRQSKPQTACYNNQSNLICSTSPDSETHGRRNSKSQKEPVLQESKVISLETEATSD